MLGLERPNVILFLGALWEGKEACLEVKVIKKSIEKLNITDIRKSDLSCRYLK